MLARRTVRVVNSTGLHARPCHAVVATAMRYQSRLSIRCREHRVDGRSILQLMTLNAHQDSELELEAEGEDAEGLLESLAQLIEGGFEESP